jgi:PAS domain S-box-containing protein
MAYLEGVTAVFLKAGKGKVLSVTGSMILLIALADWAVGTRASLGLLYIIPMMLGATVLIPWQTVALALICSALRGVFDLPSPRLEVFLRFIFASLAYTGAGMFVIALMRNRQLAIEHLGRIRREQELRHEIEEQLKTLVESSPAAILTLDDDGVVLAANRAADELFLIPRQNSLKGKKIASYVPLLADAIQVEKGNEGFRTAAQCQGRRENGEIFLAHTWFSSYVTPEGARLAAIVVDSSEEMRDREEQALRQSMRSNRIAAAAVSHELRNLCGAISLLCGNLQARQGGQPDEDLQGMVTLVRGLERIASYDLQSNAGDSLEEVALREVLDDLRIVIEPDWREINGTVLWSLPSTMPMVLAERHGLFQAFLNLAQNSHRAVQACPVRELSIEVSVEDRIARVRFRDTGPGIADPKRLFEPFQPGADGSGLGLYVSRAMVRSYGGELRFEAQTGGTCFTVEMSVV